jgi:hypothetical protein
MSWPSDEGEDVDAVGNTQRKLEVTPECDRLRRRVASSA